MIKFITILAIILSMNSANARWTLVATSESGKTYMDLMSVKREGFTVIVWELVDLSNVEVMDGKSYSSWTSLNEYECIYRKNRTLEANFYSGNMAAGVVVLDLKTPTKWSRLNYDSIGWDVMSAACKHK